MDVSKNLSVGEHQNVSEKMKGYQVSYDRVLIFGWFIRNVEFIWNVTHLGYSPD